MRAAQVEDVRNQLLLHAKPVVRVNTEWEPTPAQMKEKADYITIKPDQVFQVSEVSEKDGVHTGWYRGKLRRDLTPGYSPDNGAKKGWFPSWVVEPLIAEESDEGE